MRLNHKPGEKTFVDYADGIDIYETETGEVVKTQLFVGTLPFSSRVYAEFSFSQKTPSFIASHERMWKFLGGVTPYTVSDNLKSAVIKADLYDPDRNKTFCAYANHAGFALLPARPRRPKGRVNNWRACYFITTFPVTAHQTGRAYLTHPAFIAELMPSLSSGQLFV